MDNELRQDMSIEAELDAMFSEEEEEAGKPSPDIIRAIIADRRQAWQTRIAALQVDMHVARVLKDEQQIGQLREQGRRALQALQVLKEMESGLTAS